MGVETEVKVVLEDAVEFRRRLSVLKPVDLSPRHFEDNYMLDYPDGRIRSQGGVIRVRLTDRKSCFTYKGPPHPTGVFKSREELETGVEDGWIILQVLEKLGLRTWFRYQKYRQEYVLVPGQTQPGEVHVAVDTTPIGDFAELEGSEENIRAAAAKLGFQESQFLRNSYYSLYARFCQERGNPVTHMIFPPVPDGKTASGREESL